MGVVGIMNRLKEKHPGLWVVTAFPSKQLLRGEEKKQNSKIATREHCEDPTCRPSADLPELGSGEKVTYSTVSFTHKQVTSAQLIEDSNVSLPGALWCMLLHPSSATYSTVVH